MSLFPRFVKVLGVTALAVSSAFAATNPTVARKVGGLNPRITVTPKARIVDKIDNSKLTVRTGSHTKVIDSATDLGRIPSNTPMKGLKVVLTSSVEQEFALSKLLDEQQDRNNENYHQWLTPDTFAASFGVHQTDLNKVTAWLQDQGFTINKVMKGSRIITFTGNSGQVEKAFHTEMHSYMVDGKQIISNSGDISIPTALAPVVKGMARLNNIQPTHDLKAYKGSLKDGHVNGITPLSPGTPDFATSSALYDQQLVGGSDLAVLYNTAPLLSQGYAGAGFTVGIIGRTDVLLSDVQVYRTVFGLPVNDPNIVLVDGDPSTIADDGESDLDLELSGAMAPKATINFYTANEEFEAGVDSSAVYAVEQNVADVISESYGQCESSLAGYGEIDFFGTIWEQAAAQGQSVFISTGDDGPSTCGTYGSYSVNGIGSTPWNVAVGGTQFNEGASYNAVSTLNAPASQYWGPATGLAPNENALRQIPDQPWNESSHETDAANFPLQNPGYIYGGLTGGGSGISYYWQTPSWQAGYGVPTSDATALPIAGSTPATAGAPYGVSTSAIVTNGGYGYTSVPTVVISDPGNPSAVLATGTAAINVNTGKVTSVTLTSYGSNMDTNTVVNFTGGGGSGATAALNFAASPYQGPGPHRYMPDVSLNASVLHDGTAFCSEGICQVVGANMTTSNSCYGSTAPVGTLCKVGIVGGTSVAAPSMAGAQAVIDSYLAGVNAAACKTAGLTTSQCGRQGNPNYYYYRAANAQSRTACISSNYTGTGVCSFHDIQQGNTEMPASNRGGPTYFGWNSGPGFDLAVGLGSPDVAGLAAAWNNISFNATTTALNLTDTVTGSTNSTPTTTVTGNHADEFAALVSVYPVSGSGTPTGDVSIEAQAPGLLNFNYADYGVGTSATGGYITLSGYASGNGSSAGACIGGGLDNYFVGSCTYDYLSYSGMPGGTYNVYAHYAGDTTFGGSYSPAIAVNITAESAQLQVVPYSFTNRNGPVALNAPYNYNYGQEIYMDGYVCDAIGVADENYGNDSCADGTPTGTVTWGLSTAGTTLPSLVTNLDPLDDTYLISSAGTSYYEPNYPSVTAPVVLAPGVYTLTAKYSGDGSFSASSITPISFTINPVNETLTLTSATADVSTTSPATFYATMPSAGATGAVGGYPASAAGAAYPTGTVTFTDTTTSTVLGSSAMVNGATSFVAAAGSFTTAGNHSITATFVGTPGAAGGSSYYNTVTSSAKTVTVTTGQASSITLNSPAPFNFDSASGLTATVTTAANNSGGGTVYFYDSATGVPVEVGAVTLSNGTATSHTATLGITAALTGGTHIMSANYGGSSTVSSSNTTTTTTLVVNKLPAILNLDAQLAGDIGYNTQTINGVTTTIGAAMQVQFNSVIFPTTSTAKPAVTPTGTFSFYADYVSQASPGTLLNPVGALGQYQPGGYYTFMANATTTLLTPGPHTLTAVYNGDTNYLYSVSDTLPVNVGLTTLPMTASASTIGTGEPITLKAVVTPVTGTVSKIGGTVTFTDTFTPAGGGAAVVSTLYPYPAVTPANAAIVPVNGTLTTVGTATATLVTTLTGAGSHVITASYSGDSRFYHSLGSLTSAVTAITPGFTLQIVPNNPTSLTITRGTSGSFPIQATVTGNWAGTAPLVCVGLPANSYCTFTFPSNYNPPSYFTFSGTNGVYGPVTVTISTYLPHEKGAKGAGLLWLPALLLAGFLGLRRKHLTLRQRQLMVLAVLLCGSLATTACSSLGMATPTGPYTVQVQANGVGSTSASPAIQPLLQTPLTLTVQ